MTPERARSAFTWRERLDRSHTCSHQALAPILCRVILHDAMAPDGLRRAIWRWWHRYVGKVAMCA